MNIIPHFIEKKYKEGKYNGILEASVIFADISGFTAMTEKLSTQGKEGAEILSGMINEVFTPCIESIYSRRGFIANFIGDAILAIFPGNTEDALLSALDIINIIEKEGRKTTKFGDFKISIKIGISCGNIEWGITGGMKKSYYFRGKAVESACNSEKHSRLMDIIIDRSFIAKNGNSGKLNPVSGDYYRVLEWRNRPRKKAISNLDKIPKIDNEIIKAFNVGIIADSNPVDELRDIVSIFLSFRHEDKDYKSLNRFITGVTEITDKWGGYFSRISFADKGGNILINFGIPVSYERNIQRALNCIHEIKSNYGKGIRAGITFGRLFAGCIGNSLRSSYDVLGDAVNLSARIAIKAEWGEIWIAENILDTAERSFETSMIGKFTLKGKSQAQILYRLGSPAFAGKKALSGTFHGRDDEIKDLKKHISVIFEKRFAGIIYVYGEAGIGKSRLVYETLQKIKKPVRICTMQCDSIVSKPFNPFIHYLKEYFMQNENQPNNEKDRAFENIFISLRNSLKDSEDILNELAEAKAFIKAMLLPEKEINLLNAPDAKSIYENTIYSLKSFFKALSIKSPLIIYLEDIQHIDNDSVHAIKHLAANIINFPAAIVCTARFNDDGSAIDLEKEVQVPVKRIILKDLPDESASGIIIEKLGFSPDQKLAAFIKERTSNNPFFIEQFCLYLLETSSIRLEKGIFIMDSETEKIPARINQILIARIDRLSSEIRELAKIASVFGMEFSSSILHDTIINLDKLIECCRTIYEHKFDISSIKKLLTSNIENYLSEGKRENIWSNLDEIRYIFTHSLICRTAYDMQLVERVRILHHTAALSFERILSSNEEHYKDLYMDLAYHFERAEVRDKTIEYLEKAGNYLKEEYKNDKALVMLWKLVNYLDDRAKIAGTKLKIGDIYELTGEWERSRDIYRECIDILRETDNKRILADSYRKYGVIEQNLGNIENALNYLERSGSISEEIDYREGLSKSTGSIGLLYFHLGQYPKAMECFEKQEIIARQTGDKYEHAKALSAMGNVCSSTGRYEDALKYFKLSRSISEGIGDIRSSAISLGTMGNVYYNMDNYPEALECYESERRIMEKIRDKKAIATITGNIANIHYHEGRYDTALKSYIEQHRLFSELGYKKGIGYAMGNMGNAYHSLGDYTRALECYESQRDIYRDIGHRSGYAFATGNMGFIYMDRGDFSKALECYEIKYSISEEIGDRMGMGKAVGNMGLVYYEMREYEKALECHRMHRKISEELGIKRGIAISENNMGNIYKDTGKYSPALKCYDKLEKLSEEIGDRMGLSIALNNKGTVYLSMGKYEEALHCFEADRDICSGCGDKNGLTVSLGSMGMVHFEKKEYDTALEYLNQSIRLSREMGIISYAFIESIFLKSEILRIKEQTEDALKIILEAKRLAEKIKNREYIQKTSFQEHLIRIKHSKESSVRNLLEMASGDITEELKADIYYEIYMADKDESWRTSAINLYESAYKGNPKYRYKKRIQQLKAE